MSGCHQPETKLIKESVENAKMRIDIFSLNTVSVNHELRIQALEKERDLGIERLKALEDSIRKKEQKVPHKCPVREGTSGFKHPLTALLAPAVCHGCKGTGIVWGDE